MSNPTINMNAQNFWDTAGVTKINESYKIDKNLHYLASAPLEVLKKIFIQYRHFTHYYIADLAILISKMPLNPLKSILAEILYEELGSGNLQDAHPKLYDDFLYSLGIKQSELTFGSEHCIAQLKTIQNSLIDNSWAYGVGLRGMGGECLCHVYLTTMYAYFSQNPAIQAMSDKIAWKFWDIHVGPVDLHHQQIIRDAIDELVLDHPETASNLIDAYLLSVEAWNTYWDHIFKSAQTKEKAPLC